MALYITDSLSYFEVDSECGIDMIKVEDFDISKVYIESIPTIIGNEQTASQLKFKIGGEVKQDFTPKDEKIKLVTNDLVFLVRNQCGDLHWNRCDIVDND